MTLKKIYSYILKLSLLELCIFFWRQGVDSYLFSWPPVSTIFKLPLPFFFTISIRIATWYLESMDFSLILQTLWLLLQQIFSVFLTFNRQEFEGLPEACPQVGQLTGRIWCVECLLYSFSEPLSYGDSSVSRGFWYPLWVGNRWLWVPSSSILFLRVIFLFALKTCTLNFSSDNIGTKTRSHQ